MDNFHEIRGRPTRVKAEFIDPDKMSLGLRITFSFSHVASVDVTWDDIKDWFDQYITLERTKDVFTDGQCPTTKK